MTGALSGVRGRVTFSVLAVAAVLYSLLGTVGFLALAGLGERAIERRVDEVLNQLEDQVRSGIGAVEINTPDGVNAATYTPDAVPPAPAGTVQRVEVIDVGGTQVALVGTASTVAADSRMRAIYVALWVAVPLASVLTAAAAGVATARALRPVGDITALATTIGANPGSARVPVPDTGDEIEQLAVTLNDMLARIDAGRAEQRQFTSDAAHELRTPLMALQGELELATRGLQPADEAMLARASVLAERLAERVDDLVLLSTLDEGRPLRREPVDLEALVRAVVEEAPPATLTGAGAMVEVDPALAERAVRNLVANARRHCTEQVAVSLAALADRVWVHVDDDGPGVDVDDAQRLFRRFARLDEARSRDHGGAGLGLAIVASVAVAHGGGVDVGHSTLGGARFSVWFPLTPAQPAG